MPISSFERSERRLSPGLGAGLNFGDEGDQRDPSTSS